MSTLYIYRGLPASGKTTNARAWVAEAPEQRVRVNRDDLRMMVHDGLWKGKSTENIIVTMRDRLINEALCQGYDVASDDTNLPQRTVGQLQVIARACGSKSEVIDLTHVDPKTCSERNKQRIAEGARGVPDEVIWNMWMRYVKGQVYPLPVRQVELTEGAYKPADPYNPQLPDAAIVDIDGTVAHMSGRSPYDYTKVSEDTPDMAVINLAQRLAQDGIRIVFVSGRKAYCRADTEAWLRMHVTIGFKPELYMRANGDNRADSIVKYELFDRHIRGKYNVRWVLDDRNQVVAMWRKIGLKCLQVEEGNF